MINVGPNNDLILATGKHGAHDTVGLFEGIGVKLLAIL